MKFEVNRIFWERFTYALIFALTLIGSIVGIGPPSQQEFFIAFIHLLLLLISATLGTLLFKISNDNDMVYGIGLALYCFPLMIFLWIIGYYFRQGAGLYFTPFILLFSWLICQWFYTTIPDD